MPVALNSLPGQAEGQAPAPAGGLDAVVHLSVGQLRKVDTVSSGKGVLEKPSRESEGTLTQRGWAERAGARQSVA